MALAEAARQEQARQEMTEHELAELKMAGEAEKRRRLEQAHRVVCRMVKQELWEAFNALRGQVKIMQGQRVVLGRVVGRISMRVCAKAWGSWLEHLENVRLSWAGSSAARVTRQATDLRTPRGTARLRTSRA